VLAGVGQVTARPDETVPLGARPEPVELMVRALGAAAEDAAGVAAGADAPAGRALLERAQSLRVVAPLAGQLVNPGLLVAERLGIAPTELVLSTVGGNTPQAILHHSAAAIARGDLDVVLVTGAECIYTLAATRRHPGEHLQWAHQDPATTPAPVSLGDDRQGLNEAELAVGLTVPVQVYPLFENALRAASGWSLDEHRGRIGALWSSFSSVASANPYAWAPRTMSAEAIMTPGEGNRMISFPYTKWCNANLQVDQGAAYVLCSAEAARAAGVPEDRWVFPLSGADAHDHWFVSERADLHSSPAIRLTGSAALAMAGLGVDDLHAVDLYSCFPCAVQIGAAELGLAADDPDRPLTVTGGLTFAGGPGNNYASHAIASMAGRLRAEPGAAGLVSALGWYLTKHAVGVFASRPPSGTFSWRSVQAEVDALPRCGFDPNATGPVTIESYTIAYDRDGSLERGVVACRPPSGTRTWASVEDPDDLGALTTAEGVGREATVGADRTLRLS